MSTVWFSKSLLRSVWVASVSLLFLFHVTASAMASSGQGTDGTGEITVAAALEALLFLLPSEG